MNGMRWQWFKASINRIFSQRKREQYGFIRCSPKAYALG